MSKPKRRYESAEPGTRLWLATFTRGQPHGPAAAAAVWAAVQDAFGVAWFESMEFAVQQAVVSAVLADREPELTVPDDPFELVA